MGVKRKKSWSRNNLWSKAPANTFSLKLDRALSLSFRVPQIAICRNSGGSWLDKFNCRVPDIISAPFLVGGSLCTLTFTGLHNGLRGYRSMQAQFGFFLKETHTNWSYAPISKELEPLGLREGLQMHFVSMYWRSGSQTLVRDPPGGCKPISGELRSS